MESIKGILPKRRKISYENPYGKLLPGNTSWESLKQTDFYLNKVGT